MAVEIEGLKFEIEGASEDSIKGIDALAGSFKKLNSALSGNKNLENSAKQLEVLSKSVSALSNSADTFSKLGNALTILGKAKISSTSAKSISSISTALKSITDSDITRVTSLADAMGKLGTVGSVKIPKVATATPTTSNVGDSSIAASTTMGALNSASKQMAETTVRTTSSMTQGVFSAKNAFLGLFSSIRQAGSGAFSTLSTNVGNVINRLRQVPYVGGAVRGLSTIFKGVGFAAGSASGGVSTIANKLKQIGGTITNKASSSLRRLVGNIFNVGNTGKQASGKLGQFLNSIKRIALYRAIRSSLSALVTGMKEGINNLYQFSAAANGTFAQSMNNISSNAQYLKNSLGAMASPLINALSPAIDFVTDKLVFLFNLINQVFSRLAGKSTYTVAKKVATSFGGAAQEAAGTATDAAKTASEKIKRYTLGFDELNIAGDTKPDSSSSGTGSGSGGASGAGGGGGAFEEVPIDNSVSNFMDRIKKAFNEGDWKGLGTIIGARINESIEGINWAGVGAKLGRGIDGAVKTLYYILDTIDFRGLGGHLADLLNNALSNIDFSFVGRLIVKPFLNVIDLIGGFFAKLDFGLVAKSICDFIKGAFSEVTEWLDSVDWSKVGETIYKKIKDFITNIDYAGLASSLFKLLGTAIGAAAQLLGGIIGSIAEDIHKWWVKNTKDKNWGEIALWILKGIGKGFLGIVEWIGTNIISPFMTGLFGGGWFEKLQSFGKDLINKLKDGMKEAWSDIKEALSGWLEDTKNDIGSGWSKVKNKTSEAWSGIKSNLSTTWKDLKTSASGSWDSITSSVSGSWDKVKTKTSSTWDDVSSKLSKHWSNFKTDASSTWSNLTNTVSSSWSGIQSSTNDKWGSVKSTLSSSWSTLKSNASSTWSTLGDTVNSKWSSIKSNTSSVWSSIGSNLKSNFSTMKSNFSSTFSSLSSTASSKFSTIKSTVSNAVAKLKSYLKFNWKLPSIKLPHFNISGSFSLSPPSVPSFSISWHKTGAILDGAQIFGMMGGGHMLGGGEAGREALLPLDSHTEWMDDLARRVASSTMGYNNSEQLADSVRNGVYDANTRQNDLLKEQNNLLRQLLDKDTSVEISTSSLTKSMERQNRRNGKTVVPVGV